MEIVARREVTIVSPNGLHARPADLFARLANRYESTIEVVKDREPVNGKSTLEMLMLAAMQGTVLTICARGRDAHEAVKALAELIEHQVVLLEAEEAGDKNSNTPTGSVHHVSDTDG
jgi:phosphotransferase system HPr (HPr) family protein